jgi:membrane protein YqaA with SNARE-associated domain
MDTLLSAEAGLTGLFLYAFLAATLLPGGSEFALFAFLQTHPEALLEALLLVTAGNTLGGLSSYACGRFLPRWRALAQVPHMAAVQRHGNAVLLLSWVPLLGDLLCVAAGWLRTDWRSAALYMLLGKLARYLLVAQGSLWF